MARVLTRCKRAASSSAQRYRRTSHRDFPPVLGAEPPGATDMDPEGLLEFEDSTMRHEKWDRNIRMHPPEDRPLRSDQRAFLEERHDDQLRGRVRALEVATRVRDKMEDETAYLRSTVWMGEEIPASAETFRITHLGAVDGTDVPVEGPPLELRRALAFTQARRLGLSLCCTSVSHDGLTAYCRMRHFDAWLVAESKRRIAERTAQMQSNLSSEKDGVEFQIRSGCNPIHLEDKANQMCRALFEGRRVRVHVRHTVTAPDAADMLAQVCEYVQQCADLGTSIAVHFRQEMPVFSRTGAMMVLVPLGEGRTKTELVDYRMLMQHANAFQRMEERDFERKVQEEGEYRRTTMEEARRRVLFGAHEDFVGAKMRDRDRLARREPWSEPATPHETQQLELQEEMRMAGEEQIMETDFTCRTSWGEQDIESPEVHREMLLGKSDDIYGDRDPMQYAEEHFSETHPGLHTPEPSIWAPAKSRPRHPLGPMPSS
eukprot:Hpha_TRINITY_DN464_c0_g1::TRINITY_DN464_c0_g1_i1::g.27779::m.27779